MALTGKETSLRQKTAQDSKRAACGFMVASALADSILQTGV
jgi:hypothetical protein